MGYSCKCLKNKNRICLLETPHAEECMKCNKPDIYQGKRPKTLSKSDMIQKCIGKCLEKYEAERQENEKEGE